MSASVTEGGRSSRPTLPPIRDLFRNELLRRPSTSHELSSLTLARLQVSDEDEGPSICRAGQGPSAPPLYGLPLRHSEPTLDLQQHARDRTELYRSQSIGQIPPFHVEAPSFGQIAYEPRRNSHPRPSNAGPSSHPYHTQARHRATISPCDSQYSYGAQNLTRHKSEMALADPSLQPWNISTSVSHNSVEDDERTPIARYGRGHASPAIGGTTTAFPQDPNEGVSSGPAKYECQYCGKGFTRPSSLKIHVNSHTGEKPFACPVASCGRSFSVLSNMRRHARVHSAAPLRDPSNEEPHGSSSSEAFSPRWHHRRNSSASASSTTTRSVSSEDLDDLPGKTASA